MSALQEISLIVLTQDTQVTGYTFEKPTRQK